MVVKYYPIISKFPRTLYAGVLVEIWSSQFKELSAETIWRGLRWVSLPIAKSLLRVVVKLRRVCGGTTAVIGFLGKNRVFGATGSFYQMAKNAFGISSMRVIGDDTQRDLKSPII